MTLLIMAAGMSSRYGALKQFEKLGPNNEYLFEFSIFDAIENGFTHIAIVTNEKFVDELKNYLQKKLPKTINVDIIAQQVADLPTGISKIVNREKPWGTAHAVWTVRNFVDDDFVIINADDYYGYDAFRLAANFIGNKNDNKVFGLVSYSLNETLSEYGTVSRGICKVNGSLLQSIYEYKEIEVENGLISDKKANKVFNGNEVTNAIRNLTISDKKLPLYKSSLIQIEYLSVDSLFTTYPDKEDNNSEKEQAHKLFYALLLEKSIDVSDDCKAVKFGRKLLLPPVVEIYKNTPVLIAGFYNIYWAIEEYNKKEVPCITIKHYSYVPPEFYYKPIHLPLSFLSLIHSKFEIEKNGTTRAININF